LLKLLAPGCTVTGHVYFNGRDLLTMKSAELRKVRGRELALILQSPAAALNPVLRIGTQLREAWRAHEPDDGRSAIREALQAVGLPTEQSFLRRYPGQISTGQGQRVLIAMALLHRPALIVADEPTSALDAITQAEVLQLLKRCNLTFGTGVLLISHDLAALESVCDRVAILHEGRIVDCASTVEILRHPKHWFTERLTSARCGKSILV
jgi:peptide/nickel transport system ATP-binding protein